MPLPVQVCVCVCVFGALGAPPPLHLQRWLLLLLRLPLSVGNVRAAQLLLLGPQRCSAAVCLFKLDTQNLFVCSRNPPPPKKS